jgi:hypothetical protein
MVSSSTSPRDPPVGRSASDRRIIERLFEASLGAPARAPMLVAITNCRDAVGAQWRPTRSVDPGPCCSGLN